MAKIQKPERRNPGAAHVKAWHAYRTKVGRPKATVRGEDRRKVLDIFRFMDLTIDYDYKTAHFNRKSSEAVTKLESILTDEKDPAAILSIKRKLHELRFVKEQSTVAPPQLPFTIAKDIMRDFHRTAGLRVFGFGVGYGNLLFFLKNYAQCKVSGADFGEYSKNATKNAGLGVIHGVSAADPVLQKQGTFDVTYSINFFGSAIINTQTARGFLENLAKMTRRGGKSYHIMLCAGRFPLGKAELEKAGFQVDSMSDIFVEGLYLDYLKMTKISD